MNSEFSKVIEYELNINCTTEKSFVLAINIKIKTQYH